MSGRRTLRSAKVADGCCRIWNAPTAGPLWGRVFRYPYLREGDTLQKRRAVRRWLAAQGYQIARVTVYFDDWAWNDAYARCVGRPDPGTIQWLKQSFLQR